MVSRSIRWTIWLKNKSRRKEEGLSSPSLKCKDETLYTGWTNDIEKRLEAHNAGKGAKYTRSRRPVELVYLEQFETKEEAMRREYAIKHMTRRAKLGLVMSYKETGQ